MKLISIFASLILATSCSASSAVAPVDDSASLSTPTVPLVRTVSISGSGDILTHSRQYNVAWNGKTYNFTKMFAPLKDLLQADINLCHLETPLTKSPPSGYPVFSTPVTLAPALKAAGFDGCSLASNHTLDKGKTGALSTIRTMRDAGLTTFGTALNANDSSVGWFMTENGVRVAVLNYTYGLNGFRIPADSPWLVNVINQKKMLKAAKIAKQDGANIVLFSLHWGNEYWQQASSSQKLLARKLTKSPYVDGIIGHHSHVFQETDVINGKPVIYGLGNLWSGQGPWASLPLGQHGAIVTLNFEVEGDIVRYISGSYVPTLTVKDSWVVQEAATVRRSDQIGEACRSIKNAAKHLGQVLDGPRKCP
jgi:poly-gamma-glutamate synthesis protein (capsule biosynthesis protein)